MIEKMYIKPILKSKRLNKYILSILALIAIFILGIKYFTILGANIGYGTMCLILILCIASIIWIIDLMYKKAIKIQEFLFSRQKCSMIKTKAEAFEYLARFFIGQDNMALDNLVNKAFSNGNKMEPEELRLLVYAIIANNLDREGKTNHE